ncbi:hypothetical protein [Anaeromicrobium sediminis]|uniref:Uncharacterized protein n=1 Tax=Anaeromicrobium sediminis TaxID=1478221 RepID=A0A267MFY0_9FIRM|nr:hypothetical protein [Anaeromicrobium sediminis]PAB58456.1 hypothetical protein CCE28_15215 [Anaeromicrobium sediminis]
MVGRIATGLFQGLAAEAFISNYRKSNKGKQIQRRWHRMFENIHGQSIGLNRKTVQHIGSTSSVKRYFYKTFEPMAGIVTTRDLSMAVGIELSDRDIRVRPHDVRQLSRAIRNEWIKILISTEVIQDAMSVLGKNVRDHLEDDHDKNEIEETIGDRVKLREAYFKTYHQEEEDDIVRVGYNYNALTTDVTTNKFKADIKTNKFSGFEMGFYRKGYDYTLISDEEERKFHTMNKKYTREYIHFK